MNDHYYTQNIDFVKHFWNFEVVQSYDQVSFISATALLQSASLTSSWLLRR